MAYRRLPLSQGHDFTIFKGIRKEILRKNASGGRRDNTPTQLGIKRCEEYLSVFAPLTRKALQLRRNERTIATVGPRPRSRSPYSTPKWERRTILPTVDP